MNSKEIVISIFASAFKVVLAVIIVMLVYKGSVSAYDYGQRVFNEPPITAGSGRTIRVTIAEGSTAKEIGEELEKKGLIRDARLFVIQEMLSEYKGKLQGGSYELNTSMTAQEIMEILAEGQSELELLEEVILPETGEETVEETESEAGSL